MVIEYCSDIACERVDATGHRREEGGGGVSLRVECGDIKLEALGVIGGAGEGVIFITDSGKGAFNAKAVVYWSDWDSMSAHLNWKSMGAHSESSHLGSIFVGEEVEV